MSKETIKLGPGMMLVYTFHGHLSFEGKKEKRKMIELEVREALSLPSGFPLPIGIVILHSVETLEAVGVLPKGTVVEPKSTKVKIAELEAILSKKKEAHARQQAANKALDCIYWEVMENVKRNEKPVDVQLRELKLSELKAMVTVVEDFADKYKVKAVIFSSDGETIDLKIKVDE